MPTRADLKPYTALPTCAKCGNYERISRELVPNDHALRNSPGEYVKCTCPCGHTWGMLPLDAPETLKAAEAQRARRDEQFAQMMAAHSVGWGALVLGAKEAIAGRAAASQAIADLAIAWARLQPGNGAHTIRELNPEAQTMQVDTEPIPREPHDG